MNHPHPAAVNILNENQHSCEGSVSQIANLSRNVAFGQEYPIYTMQNVVNRFRKKKPAIHYLGLRALEGRLLRAMVAQTLKLDLQVELE